MSMSTHIKGFRPPDEQWKKMKEVWDACDRAGVDPPEEVSDFFNDEAPDSTGVEIELENYEGVKPYNGEMEEGFQVDISKLPKDIKYIRFYNSY